MKAAREAGITVVSLPLVNQWTQVSYSTPPYCTCIMARGAWAILLSQAKQCNAYLYAYMLAGYICIHGHPIVCHQYSWSQLDVLRSAIHIACMPLNGQTKPAAWLANSAFSITDTYPIYRLKAASTT